MNKPAIIPGKSHHDERGTLLFNNDFDMSPVRRFYSIAHPDTVVVRAWQGHQLEQKWFWVQEGAFEIALVRPDNWTSPSPSLPVQAFHITAAMNSVLHVPAGFATGFKATSPDSRLLVFSDLSLEESAKDDYRFDKDLWHKWN